MGIPRKKKICKGCGKEKYLFGHGMCKFCYQKDRAKNISRKPIRKSRMKKSSTTNTFKSSSGYRYTKEQIDKNIAEAKQKKKEQFFDKHGYYFCEICGQNDCKPLDSSHLVSTKYAQDNAMVEISWDVDDIEYHGRKCHMAFESKSDKERMEAYMRKKI